jgi:hypothetical protein
MTVNLATLPSSLDQKAYCTVMLLRKKSRVAAKRHPITTKPKPAVNVKRGKRLKDIIQLQLMSILLLIECSYSVYMKME